MITVLQTGFALLVIILIILFVFKPKRKEIFVLPEHYKDLLRDYVLFYANLEETEKQRFEDRLHHFLSAVKINGANAEVEDLDRVLIGAAAIIPVFHIPDWEYVNLREILLYPGNFNMEFEQQGHERMVSGMVGTGPMQNMMILSKWEVRQGFIQNSNRNVAIHEFVHLIDKMDGSLDGVPELLLERKYLAYWQTLMENSMNAIRAGQSDIDAYAATSAVECFAVLSEYYFAQPGLFRSRHPELAELMNRIYYRTPSAATA